MKRIGLIALAIVLSLGLLGVGFAQWTETLNIEGTADTGNFIVSFDNGGGDDWTIPDTTQKVDLRGLISNDDAICDQALWCNGDYLVPVVPDPDDDGGDPTGPQTMGQNVNRLGNYASTTVTSCGVNDPIRRTVTVTMENAYPSYWPTVFFSIRNWGTIPAKVQSIRLIEVSVGDTLIDISDVDLEVCQRVCVSINEATGAVTVTVVGPGEPCPECTDFSLHLSDDEGRLFQILAAGGGVEGEHAHYLSAVCGNLDIHIGQCAEELTDYDFVIEIVAVPFNK